MSAIVSLPSVTIGSRWRFPDEDEVWRVGALVFDGTEMTALCFSELYENSVLHFPATVLAATAEPEPA